MTKKKGNMWLIINVERKLWSKQKAEEIVVDKSCLKKSWKDKYIRLLHLKINWESLLKRKMCKGEKTFYWNLFTIRTYILLKRNLNRITLRFLKLLCHITGIFYINLAIFNNCNLVYELSTVDSKSKAI